ncbi:hypothetical protein [Micromonospora sp. NBC_01796]|uniref:hypothetical protein n=1 Tax=Micromonospora sp. NBC_01796 TaxID=2975987 RepID=UPI003FA3552F
MVTRLRPGRSGFWSGEEIGWAYFSERDMVRPIRIPLAAAAFARSAVRAAVLGDAFDGDERR